MTTHEPLPPAATLLLKPLNRLATAASVLIALTCLASVADTVADWNRYLLVDDYLGDRGGVTYDDLVGADDVSLIVAIMLTAVSLAAGIVFLVWLWQARLNSERIAFDANGLGRGWTIGSWFCPVVNLWFPFRIVNDIWLASRPEGVPAENTPVRLWWAAWIGTWLGMVWLRFASRGEITVDLLHDVAVANTVTTILQCLAGVLVIQVVRRISRWQATPRRATEDPRRA